MFIYIICKSYLYLLRYYQEVQVNAANTTNHSMSKQDFNDIYKNEIELSTTISELMTTNPLLAMNSGGIESRESIIRDMTVIDRKGISIPDKTEGIWFFKQNENNDDIDNKRIENNDPTIANIMIDTCENNNKFENNNSNDRFDNHHISNKIESNII